MGKTGKIPASKTVLNSAEFKAIQPEASLAESLDYAHFPPPLAGVADVLTQFWTGYQAAILGKADPASARRLRGEGQPDPQGQPGEVRGLTWPPLRDPPR